MKKNLLSTIKKNLITLGPVGYLPGSGTCATIVSLIIVWLLYWLHVDTCAYGLITFLIFIIAVFLVRQLLPVLNSGDDPSEIVIDEVVGTLITFFGIAISWQTVLIGFLAFRFYDIAKPGFVRIVERLPGAWGIMLDDIIAGIFANIWIRIFLMFIPWLF